MSILDCADPKCRVWELFQTSTRFVDLNRQSHHFAEVEDGFIFLVGLNITFWVLIQHSFTKWLNPLRFFVSLVSLAFGRGGATGLERHLKRVAQEATWAAKHL